MQENADRYRRLSEALLEHLYGFDRVEVTLGALPAEWPAFAAPPAQAAIVGSVTRRRDGALAAIALYLENVPPGTETLDQFETSLRGEGWSRFDRPEPGHPGGGGFRSAAPMAGTVRVFCRGESDPFLAVQVSERAGRSEAVATWDTGLGHHPLREHWAAYGPGGPLGRLIPDLAPPEGVPVQGGGGGGSDTEWEIRARALTNMAVTDLAAHYREQLRRAGWTLHDEGGDGVVRWSRWKLKEDDYEGMFLVAEPLPDLRDLTLVIRSPSRAGKQWRLWRSSAVHTFGYRG